MKRLKGPEETENIRSRRKLEETIPEKYRRMDYSDGKKFNT